MSNLKIVEILDKSMRQRQISEDATISDAIEVMRETRSNCLLVKDEEGRGIGILSEHDIVRAFSDEGDNAKTSCIGDYMTTKMVSINENDEIDKAIAVMTQKDIRHIPVVSNEGRLSGFISIMELLRARLK